MNAKILWSILCLVTSCISRCQPHKDQIIREKNKCYNLKLKKIESTLLYRLVHSQFNDTFEVLKREKEYFGVPEYVDNKIDDAVFFKKDSSECILIVLQRSNDTLGFGSARIIHGVKKDDSKWLFEVGMDKSFSKDYFNLYKENNFENISSLARYSILTDGDIKRKGCEIDEYYWFVHMKN